MSFLFGSSSKSASNTPATPIAHTAAAKVVEWRKTRKEQLEKWLKDHVKPHLTSTVLKKAERGHTVLKFTSTDLALAVPVSHNSVADAVSNLPSVSEWNGTGDSAWLQPALLDQLKQLLDVEKLDLQHALIWVDGGNDIMQFTITWPEQPPAAPAPAEQPQPATAPATASTPADTTAQDTSN